MRIGEYQTLQFIRNSPHGIYLTDGEMDVLLPKNQAPKDIEEGESLRVFLYTDSEDRLIATTQEPLGTAGEFANLQVVSISDSGAFFDWGLAKDLLCPFAQQQFPLEVGQKSVVRILYDEVSHRMIGSTKLHKFLESGCAELAVGDAVKLMVISLQKEAIGMIINDKFRGTLFADEWTERLKVGDVRRGYIKAIREDDKKIAVSLRPQGYQAVLGESERVLKALRIEGGFLAMNDKSSPEEIQRRFKMSKGSFKKLIGSLYREGVITIEEHGIRLVKQ